MRNDPINPPLPLLAGVLLSVGQNILNRSGLDRRFLVSVAEYSRFHSLVGDYELVVHLQAASVYPFIVCFSALHIECPVLVVGRAMRATVSRKSGNERCNAPATEREQVRSSQNGRLGKKL